MSESKATVAVYGSERLSGACRLEVTIVFSTVPDLAVATAEVGDVFGAFAAAGRLGAYVLAGDSKIESTIEYEGQLVTHDHSVSAVCVASNIDPRAFQLLRNMLGEMRARGTSIDSIRVEVSGFREGTIARLPEITNMNESEAYPTAARASDFPGLIWADSEFSKLRRVLVEFYESPPKLTFERMKTYADAWYLLLEKGAFSRPFGPPFETQSIRGTLSRFDEVTNEISISRFIASEAGFKLLANMLGHFSRYVSRLARVEID